jgi:glycosyltransferase involved in cell wall biosynthesis
MHWGVWLPAAFASRLSGIPSIYSYHGIHSRRAFLQRRFAAKLTTKVVMLTHECDNYMQSWGPIPKMKIEVIPNGIDVHKFSTAGPTEIGNISKHATVIGMISRMCPPKDVQTFIQAAKLIVSVHLGDRATRQDV